MGITNSYTTALSKNKEMAKNHDLPVLEWKREIETSNRDSTLPEYQVSISDFKIIQCFKKLK